MFNRPYTAICQNSNGFTSAISIDAPDGHDKARAAVKDKYPDLQVVAMIPGVHSGHAYVYDSPAVVPYPKSDSGGPWPENLPPGF